MHHKLAPRSAQQRSCPARGMLRRDPRLGLGFQRLPTPPRELPTGATAGAGSHKHRHRDTGNAAAQIKQPRAARTRIAECFPPWSWEQSQMLINTQPGAQHVTRHVSKAPGKPPFPLLASERDRKIPTSPAMPFPPPVPGSNHPCEKFPSLLTSPLSQMHCLQMFPKNAL